MLKRRYVKRAYIEEAICDKCGSPMRHTGVVLTSFPAQYPYVCTNEDCDGKASYLEYDLPGRIKYEFEEETYKEFGISTEDFSKRINELFSPFRETDSLKEIEAFVNRRKVNE